MSRSAYFPSDDAGERSLGVSFLAPPPPRHHVVVSERQLLVHSSPSCSEFPITSYVLWDRSPLSAVVRSVGSRGDSFPRLYMSCASIDALLSDMDGSGLGGGDVLFAAEQVDGGVLSLSRVVSSPSAAQASVPVSVVAYSASLQSLLFSPESTQDLIMNLRVQYMTGRNYTLKSCFRIRAAGFISNSTTASLHGTLRFEVLVPNETFSFQQIRPLPLLSTPLSMKLTAVSSLSSVTGCSSSLHGGDGMPRQMGYLTLNKTRKAVPLHETDPAVSLAPLVGVWVTASNAGSCETVHRDPFVVGACVRFLKDSRIRERVFVDSEKTFLLAIFSGYSTEFMEVSHESANNDGGEGDDFCVLDFTVDLSRGGEPVLGNFRGRGGQGGDHDVSTTSDASVAVTSLLQIKYYGDVQILTNNNSSSSSSSSSSSNPASLVEETPLPRTSMQLPTPEAYRASPQGTLRASLSLSEGTFSNRSSLDDEQLMRVRELVGGLRESEEYADDFDTEDDAEAGFCSGGGGGNNDKIGFEESDGGDDESSCSGGSSQNSRSSSQKSQGATVAANPIRTSPQQGSKALDSDDEDYLEDASMLAPRLMSIPNDDSDFTLSSAMRRIYFPTNPLASLSPCVPALRPLGEDDCLLMETCMVGLRLSTNSNPFSAAVTQDLEEQVRDIMLHDQDD